MRISILAATVALLAHAHVIHAQPVKQHGHCTGDVIDSTTMGLMPIYRDCEVDKPAKVKRDIKPALSFLERRPPHGCMRAEYEFVVDTTGSAELGSVRLISTSDNDMAKAVLEILPAIRYTPAQLDKQPVRQLTRYVSAAQVLTAVVRGSSSGGGPPPSGPPPSMSGGGLKTCH